MTDGKYSYYYNDLYFFFNVVYFWFTFLTLLYYNYFLFMFKVRT